jgi:hypothetical protein
MDESQDPKPHPHVEDAPHPVAPAGRGEALSIWFFVGILTLVYGIVLTVQGLIELHNPPHNEVLLPFLIPLHPTLYWGMFLFVFGAFYTVRFRPGKG